jgi:alcohol dehydrogenase (cytochrome c)
VLYRAGVTPTAGGVTFTGDLAGNLLVFNSKTGQVVHKVKTGGALAGGVVTYEAANKQYVAFASGNISRNAFGDLGFPSVVIMTLNADRTTRTATAASASTSGRTLYGQVCVSCHGPNGDMLADHKLSTLKARRDLADTIRYIKDPKAPMPKLYPDLIDEQSVANVATYVREELPR